MKYQLEGRYLGYSRESLQEKEVENYLMKTKESPRMAEIEVYRIGKK